MRQPKSNESPDSYRLVRNIRYRNFLRLSVAGYLFLVTRRPTHQPKLGHGGALKLLTIDLPHLDENGARAILKA